MDFVGGTELATLAKTVSAEMRNDVLPNPQCPKSSMPFLSSQFSQFFTPLVRGDNGLD